MLKKILKIDVLTAVLLASIMSIYSFSKQVRTALHGKTSVLKKFEQLNDIVHLPDSTNNKLFLYDPHFTLKYSVNGGDTYIQESRIEPNTIKVKNLSNYTLSYRSKPVNGVQPRLTSILVKTENKQSGVFTETQMVSFIENLNHKLPVLSLVTSEKGLFSEETGIMVLGNASWFGENKYYLPFWDRPANYKRRGSSSKRKASWQLIENGKVIYEAQSDFQISGNATRSFPQKSFKLKAHKFYGIETFDYRFFGKKGIKKYQSLVIRNSGNDNTKTLFADLLMHNLAKKSNVLTQRGKPIVVYINGNYWGIYNLRERIDVYMIARKEDAKSEDITILEGGSGLLKDGHNSEANRFKHIIEDIKKNNDETSFQDVSEQIDINSFIDYIFFETYFGNGDWLNNNALWYAVKNDKWKWILNDLDYGLAYQGMNNVNKNYFNDLKNSGSVNAILFNFLITKETFRATFLARTNELIDTLLSDEKINKSVNKLKSKIDSEIAQHLKRWRGKLTIDEWEANIEKNLNFLLQRKSIYKTQVNSLL